MIRVGKRTRIGLVLLGALLVWGCGAAPAQNGSPAVTSKAAATDGCMAQAPSPPKKARKVTITRVIDGDTVEINGGENARLIGINTPESVDPRRPVQAYGKEASAFAKQLLQGKQVLLQEGATPRDRYGRLLGWFWLPDGRFVNALLVAEGYAQVYTFSDNPDNAPLLLACQREARAANRGLWALPEYQNGAEAAKMDRSGSTSSTGSSGTAGTPSSTAASGPAPVITRSPGTLNPGDAATVSARTAPGAQCDITVTYKSGPSTSSELDPKKADKEGNVTWIWRVSGSTAAGTWPVTVTCNGQTAQTELTVR